MRLSYTILLTAASSLFGWEPPKTAQEEMQDKWGGEIFSEVVQTAPEDPSETSQTAKDPNNPTGVIEETSQKS